MEEIICLIMVSFAPQTTMLASCAMSTYNSERFLYHILWDPVVHQLDEAMLPHTRDQIITESLLGLRIGAVESREIQGFYQGLELLDHNE